MNICVSTTAEYIQTSQGKVFVQHWHPAEKKSSVPIALFHDSLGCVQMWRDFPEYLAQMTGHEVVAYDRIGFGKSDAFEGEFSFCFVEEEAQGIFSELKQQLHWKQFIAFGHSVGGAMAATCAAFYPEACAGLITESAQTFAEDKTLQGIRLAKKEFTDARKMESLKKYHGDKAEWVLHAWTDTWLADEFQVWDMGAVLTQVTCPVLALHGDNDEYGSLVHPQRYASLPRGESRMYIVNQCGHMPHREHREEVVQVVVNFLELNDI